MFYSDTEILVADAILESIDKAALTEQNLIDQTHLSQRQVKATLEKLARDLITEVEYPAATGSAWYRINPNCILAAKWRADKIEREIVARARQAKESELFKCETCGREYDLLRAISAGAGSEGFFCETCPNSELKGEDNRVLRAKLESQAQRLHGVLAPLRSCMQRCDKMYIPRPVVVRRSVQKEVEAMEAKQEEIMALQLQRNRPALPKAEAKGLDVVVEAPEWITSTDQRPLQPLDHVKPESVVSGFSAKPLSSFGIKNEPIAYSILLPAAAPLERIIIAQSAKKEEQEDFTVMVGGREYSFREVQANDALVDKMTDAEFERYDQLVVRIGMK